MAMQIPDEPNFMIVSVMSGEHFNSAIVFRDSDRKVKDKTTDKFFPLVRE